MTYHCGLAEYYEWLTPEHSEFGLKKTRDFFNKIHGLGGLSSLSVSFLFDEARLIHRNKITAIDILPSKYTEVKKRYWSAIKTNETPTQKPTFTDLKQRVSDWIRSQS